jgi:hypothetical protein
MSEVNEMELELGDLDAQSKNVTISTQKLNEDIDNLGKII